MKLILQTTALVALLATTTGYAQRNGESPRMQAQSNEERQEEWNAAWYDAYQWAQDSTIKDAAEGDGITYFQAKFWLDKHKGSIPDQDPARGIYELRNFEVKFSDGTTQHMTKFDLEGDLMDQVNKGTWENVTHGSAPAHKAKLKIRVTDELSSAGGSGSPARTYY